MPSQDSRPAQPLNSRRVIYLELDTTALQGQGLYKERVLHDEDQHFGEYIESVHPSYFVNQKFINPMYRESIQKLTQDGKQ